MLGSTLFANDDIEVTTLPGEPVVLVVRKPTRVAVGDLERVWGAAVRSFDALDRKTSGLIVDVSGTVGRNDEDFEKAFAPYRLRLSTGWHAMALVVSSVPGKLQVQRYAREDGVLVSTFEDRDAALAWIRRSLGGPS
jgi:hypothetical protein